VVIVVVGVKAMGTEVVRRAERELRELRTDCTSAGKHSPLPA
jgi:hypothetical protein